MESPIINLRLSYMVNIFHYIIELKNYVYHIHCRLTIILKWYIPIPMMEHNGNTGHWMMVQSFFALWHGIPEVQANASIVGSRVPSWPILSTS